MAKAGPWTIDELGALVACSLSEIPQPSGRVRELPDRRTIRYYTTLGLIDRPSEMRGRVALYGPRHLLQLVAIKRLQAEGRSLAEIQRLLLGQTATDLARLARLPGGLAGARAQGPPPQPAAAGERRAAPFWADLPAAAATAPARALAPAGLLHAVRLTTGALLLLEGARAPHSSDLTAIQEAAEPLLRLLEERGLLDPPRPERETP